MPDSVNEYYSNPDHFGGRARDFFLAACNLRDQHKIAHQKLTSGEFVNGTPPEATFFKYPYSYLFAFSLELIFKAIIFTNNLLEQNDANQTWRRDHNLNKLFLSVSQIMENHNFTLSIDEKFLEKISENILWSARYPFPKGGDIGARTRINDMFNTKKGFSLFCVLEDIELDKLEKIITQCFIFHEQLEKIFFSNKKILLS